MINKMDFVECVDDSDVDHLISAGKAYKVVMISSIGDIGVDCDNGKGNVFNRDRFKKVENNMWCKTKVKDVSAGVTKEWHPVYFSSGVLHFKNDHLWCTRASLFLDLSTITDKNPYDKKNKVLAQAEELEKQASELRKTIEEL